MKKLHILILAIILKSTLLFADDCNYYAGLALESLKKSNQDMKSIEEYATTRKWCKLRYDKDLEVFYLKKAKEVCNDGYKLDDVIQQASRILRIAKKECPDIDYNR